MNATNTVTKQAREKIAGFPDIDPAKTIVQNRVLDIIRRHYERAGYAPLETPLVERPEILTAKANGEIRTQMYGLRLLNPALGALDDSKNLALRFDLTVPLARYVAANYGSGKVLFPFRRYAIGPVFRGERPGGQRYRQFIQADIDVIGDGHLDLLHDAEMVEVISGIFSELAVGPFTIRVNNRKVLEGLLRSAGCDTPEKVFEARNAIDSIGKGENSTIDQLVVIGLNKDAARTLVDTLHTRRSNDDMLALLRNTTADDVFAAGVEELETVVQGVRNLGVAEDVFRVDMSLARGLDYYTGTVYEAYLNAYPDVSVAGGGRYDNLAENFVARHLPGVGISIGVSRLVSGLIDKELLHADVSTVAPVLVTRALDEPRYASVYLDLARRLRIAGVRTESYLNKRKLGAQLQFAAKRGFKIAIIGLEQELGNNMVVVRDLQRGDQVTVPIDSLVDTVKGMLKS